ncbi:hypothetical protein CICLE_v10003387mg, partial [Citrus x clementina]
IARYTSLPPAHFIVKIKSLSLLAEKAEEEYESGEFEVGGYKWYIYIYIYILFLNNTSSFTLDWEVSAVFRLFLLDQNQENYCEKKLNACIMSGCFMYGVNFDKFIPLRAFNDASNGYLVEDTCVFEAEVLVKERNKFKRECQSIKEISISCKCVWKIENLDAGYEESQVFDAGNHKWYQRF